MQVQKENVVDFIWTHIIFHYHVRRYIVNDNGKPFINKLMTSLAVQVYTTQVINV